MALALSTIIANLLLHLGALVLCGAYYARNDLFKWSDPVTFEHLSQAIIVLSIDHVFQSTTTKFEGLLLSSMLIATISVFTPRTPEFLPRAFLFVNLSMGTIFTVFGGWKGLLSLPFLPFGYLDGEWLGEGWPLIESAGVWGLSCFLLAWLNWKSLRVAGVQAASKAI